MTKCATNWLKQRISWQKYKRFHKRNEKKSLRHKNELTYKLETQGCSHFLYLCLYTRMKKRKKGWFHPSLPRVLLVFALIFDDLATFCDSVFVLIRCLWLRLLLEIPVKYQNCIWTKFPNNEFELLKSKQPLRLPVFFFIFLLFRLDWNKCLIDVNGI